MVNAFRVKSVNMCISPICEDEKWSVLIEFVIFFMFMGMDIGNHSGIFFMLRKQVVECANIISKSKDLVFCAGGGNGTASALKPAQEHLSMLHLILLSFIGVGGLLFIVHLGFLLPNLIKSFTEKDMASYRESAHPYFRSVLKGHCLLLILETLLFDIPTGSTIMDIIAQLWKYPDNFNCWECATSLAGIPPDKSMDVSKMYLTLSLVGMAFIALYKGEFSFCSFNQRHVLHYYAHVWYHSS